MKREEIQDKLIDFLDQSLPEQEMKEMQEYIDNNEDFAQEVEEMKKLFFDMNEEELEQPSAALRMNFEEMLEEEKAKLSAEQSRSKETKVINLQERTSWKSYIRVAASIAIVISAFVIGTQINRGGDNTQNEIILAKIGSESASMRIDAMNIAEKEENVDTEILQAFIDRLLYDEKPSVRLTAVEALAKFSDTEMVKKALIKALETDKDPAIQIELIQVLVKIQEKRALSPMKKLLKNEDVPEYVKKEIQFNIPSLS